MIIIAEQQFETRSLKERKCNSCGQCCKDFTLAYSPEELKNKMIQYPHDKNFQSVASMVELIYTQENGYVVEGSGKEHKYHYRCNNFMQLEDGSGYCGIYDERPDMCSMFPYHSLSIHSTEKEKLKYLASNPYVAPYSNCSYNITDHHKDNVPKQVKIREAIKMIKENKNLFSEYEFEHLTKEDNYIVKDGEKCLTPQA